MRAIDVDKLCVDLMERWDTADKQKEELVKQLMADIVTPIVVSQPTVEPERKKGKWMPDNTNYYEERYICLECGRSYKVDMCMGKPMWNFCPNCGADMRGEQDG